MDDDQQHEAPLDFHGPLTQAQIDATLKRLRLQAEHQRACTAKKPSRPRKR